MENKTADEILKKCAQTYKERNAMYGPSYLNFGPTMMGLFPDGITLKTPEEFTRFSLILLDTLKSIRYCANFEKGGHQDSIHDKVVYSAMIEAFDENCTQEDPPIRLNEPYQKII